MFIDKYDGNILTGAASTDELVLIVGRYSFDKNPFIGIIADINMWDRSDITGQLLSRQ